MRHLGMISNILYKMTLMNRHNLTASAHLFLLAYSCSTAGYGEVLYQTKVINSQLRSLHNL